MGIYHANRLIGDIFELTKALKELTGLHYVCTDVIRCNNDIKLLFEIET
jgi:hypothetical protein